MGRKIVFLDWHVLFLYILLSFDAGDKKFFALSLSPASDLRCLAYVDIVGWSYHSLQRQTTIGMKAPMATKMGRNELVSSSE